MNGSITFVSCVSLVAVLFNVIAYKHAHSMLNFRVDGVCKEGAAALPLLQKLRVLFSGLPLQKPQNDEWPNDYQLPFEVHKIESDGLTLEAWMIPAPEPKGTVVLFHGYGGSKSGVLGEAKGFHQLGYNTFLVDLRGCGESDGYLTTIGIFESRDVAASFRYVENFCSQAPSTLGGLPIILYGRSMGAASILRAMATTDISPDALLIDAVFAEMVTAVKNRCRAVRIPSFPTAYALIFWASFQNKFSGFAHNPVAYATRIKTPTLVMHGGADVMATLDEGERVFGALQSHCKSFVCFDGVGHESYLANQPQKWFHEVSTFLGRIA